MVVNTQSLLPASRASEVHSARLQDSRDAVLATVS